MDLSSSSMFVTSPHGMYVLIYYLQEDSIFCDGWFQSYRIRVNPTNWFPLIVAFCFHIIFRRKNDLTKCIFVRVSSQVSYIKAIDWYLIIAFGFVFGVLVEYVFVLSDKGPQKRVALKEAAEKKQKRLSNVSDRSTGSAWNSVWSRSHLQNPISMFDLSD